MKCWWVFGHRWSKWRLKWGEDGYYQSVFQVRECLDCGRRQERTWAT